MPSRSGQLSAEQLVELFIEEDSWVPIMADATDPKYAGDTSKKGDGVLCGMGKFNGRQVCLFVQDLDVCFGTIAELHGKKVVRTIQFAIENKCAIIGIIQTGGARIQQGAASLGAASAMATKLVEASGYVPSIAIVNGPGAGGGAYMTTLSDFAIMNNSGAYMFLTGPKVVQNVLNEKVTDEELGGIDAHFRQSGLVTHQSRNILEAKDVAARILEHLPNWYNELRVMPSYSTSRKDAIPELNTFLPAYAQEAYDMSILLNLILDRDSLFEQNAGFARNIITAFARLGGRSIGIVANQPTVMGGVLDIDSTRKVSRFVQICDAYNIPLLFVMDCPGYLPGKDQEWKGVIGKGAFMTHMISRATIPRVTLIVRKAIGGAYATLNSKHLGSDYSVAWTSAEISVVGMDAALDLLLKQQLKDKRADEKILEDARADYQEKYLNPYLAASRGLVDKVIPPSESRIDLIRAFKRLENKVRTPSISKKGGILPMA